MTEKVLNRFDRVDENLVRAKASPDMIVEEDIRGSLNLKNDRAQHRRYTSFYGDLQN